MKMRYWRILFLNVIIVILSGCPFPGILGEGDQETNGEENNISFWYSPVSPAPGEMITFYAQGVQEARHLFDYEWDFGDTHSNSGSMVYHTYSSPARYSVTLIITDRNGETSSIIRDISVNENPEFSFIAYGDSRTNPGIHKQLVDSFALENPDLVIHSGDLWDDYTSLEWLSHFVYNPVTKDLLDQNKILVARGNHESEAEVMGVLPRIVKDDSIEYSFTQGNCFFICMGLDPGENNTWLEKQLQSPDAQDAVWRIIYCHQPIYSSGKSHGADGIVSSGSSVSHFRELCDTYDVTWVFSGHDHHYERTHFIFDGEISDTITTITPGTQGTFYIVTGGGGAPLYSVGSNWWTNIKASEYHYCKINAFHDHCEMVVKNIYGTVIDLVTVYK
jgi:acid phosphatase type 7